VTNTTTPQAPPGMLLFKLMESFVSGFALIAAAELGIADALAGGPLTTEELARATASHSPSLNRLLPVLVTEGVVTEVEPGRFALTATGASLQTERPGSLSPFLRMMSELMLRPLAGTAHAIRTGEPAFTGVFGAPFYDYLEKHPELDATFGRAMNALRDVSLPISQAYDFSGVHTLVDVGGGRGWRMIDVLQAHPHVRGVLLDRPGVVEQARATLAEAGLSERCDVVGGSFFEQVPDGGDCYLLSAVLPNWDDSSALKILRTIRQAMPDGARLLLFEPVLPDGDEPHIAKNLDLLMLVVLGGQVRTEAQLSRLLEAAGLRLSQVIPASAPMAVVEAVPA
jgi:O-methyltransferase domain